MTEPGGPELQQLALPSKYIEIIYTKLHKKIGHLGAGWVLSSARERVYWPFMSKNIARYVSNVCSCLKNQHPNVHRKAPLKPISTTCPFELVSKSRSTITRHQEDKLSKEPALSSPSR